MSGQAGGIRRAAIRNHRATESPARASRGGLDGVRLGRSVQPAAIVTRRADRGRSRAPRQGGWSQRSGRNEAGRSTGGVSALLRKPVGDHPVRGQRDRRAARPGRRRIDHCRDGVAERDSELHAGLPVRARGRALARESCAHRNRAARRRVERNTQTRPGARRYPPSLRRRPRSGRRAADSEPRPARARGGADGRINAGGKISS